MKNTGVPTSRNLSVKTVLLTMIGFILLWGILTDAWGYSSRIFADDNLVIGQFIYGYIIRIVWLCPAILLIIKYKDSLEFKGLFSRPKIEKVLVIFVALVTVYGIVSSFIKYGRLHINTDNLIWQAAKLALVGIVEEVVFRGWGFNALSAKLSNKKAVIISSIMFVILHWPAYFVRLILNGSFDFVGIITQSISAFLFGVLFCVLFKRSKTIWNPIIAHGYYDLAIIIFS